MKKLLFIFLNLISIHLSGQYVINGILHDSESGPIMFSNVVLYSQSDSTIVKIEVSDKNGEFSIKGISRGNYYMVASYLGFNDYQSSDIVVIDNSVDLGVIRMNASSVELETAVVTARKALIEVKSDRTVFNVQGTINSAGNNALGLLRKAPGVLVDQNNNISVLNRTGVNIYVDGKRLPLNGDDLTAYLSNLPAEQVDRIDIITNPSAKYEAEGSGGIIDIRMKRDESHGMNGSISGSLSQGQLLAGNLSVPANYRSKTLSTFGTVGYSGGESFSRMHFLNEQNNLRTVENQYLQNDDSGINYRWGTDFFLGKRHTIGFLLSGLKNETKSSAENSSEIMALSSPAVIDSVLLADNSSLQNREGNTYNLNYTYDSKGSSLIIDLDYGRYRNESDYFQPNRYYDETRSILLSEVLTEYRTPVSIDIYTAKVDYEIDLSDGKLGLGAKVSNVYTDNTFLFYNILNGAKVRNDRRSNEFFYDEEVYAVYAEYQRPINEKMNVSAGLRVESTNVAGDLRAFGTGQEPGLVESKYANYFPSAGLTYNLPSDKSISLNFGRRINRPDYNLLNPFTFQYSELSFLKGNERLNPEIVNNFELGYTLDFRYQFKLNYSRTTNQITRLVQPDARDPRANLITWENLADQTLYGFSVSAPFTVSSWWNSYLNLSAGYMDNRADYGNGAIVDVQAFTYNIFQQNVWTLPAGITGELSLWFAGPGIWGGVFEYDVRYSIDIGLQKKLFDNMMNVKLSVSDLTYQTGWSGTSNFAGLVGERRGNWDSRKVALSISHNLGNLKVKSRKRSTGIEDESKRVGN